jgi:hypothetical protein
LKLKEPESAEGPTIFLANTPVHEAGSLRHYAAGIPKAWGDLFHESI